MKIVEQQHFEYPTELGGGHAIVELRIYIYQGRRIVVASDADTGHSISDAVEELATYLMRSKIYFNVFIEHYPKRIFFGKPLIDDTFDLVEFSWAKGKTRAFPTHGLLAYDPAWRESTRAEVEALIGVKFQVVY